ncbi:MAG: hypothetical protein KAX31_03130 [Thermoplasmata archaeon]|nr:hypothetical protein [Thermoplasmata archaeon]
MSEDITPAEAKPTGDSGISSYNDVDTRMKYKTSQKGPGKTPKIKVEVKKNVQREIKLGP